MKAGFYTVVTVAIVALSACNKTLPAPQDDAPAAAAVAVPADAGGAPAQKQATVPGSVAAEEARAIMAQRCTLCHGLAGKGDGPAAANLSPKPANYTDAKWQDGIKDDELKRAIVGGGPSVGKSMMMPANPDLKDKPQVVDELVKIIRGFRK